MITILPATKEDQFEAILSSAYALNNVQKGSDPAVLIAKDGQDILGYIAVDISSYYIRILNLELTAQKYNYTLIDALLKSAASYAMNRNVFVIECSNIEIYIALEKFGFNMFNDKMYIEIPKLIGKCH